MEQKVKYTTKILVPVMDKPGDRGAFIKWTTESRKYPPRFQDFPGQQVIIRAIYTEPGRIKITVHDEANTVYVPLQLLNVTPLAEGGWLAAVRISPEIPDGEDANLPIVMRVLTHEQAVLLTTSDVQKWESEIDSMLDRIDKANEAELASFLIPRIERCGGELPSNPYFVQHGPDNKPHYPVCIGCEKQVQDADDFCPHCEIKRCAPSCTKCGERLTISKGELRRFITCVWNEEWKEVCAHCKFVYKARLFLNHYSDQITVVLGDEEIVQDPQNPKVLILTVEGETTTTANSQCDFWKVTPSIKFKRDDHIEHSEECNVSTLSVRELKIVLDLLNGPLKPLMDRDEWTYDTT